MLFISHDLAVVEYLCDEMVVMYLGRVMERGPSRTIYARPRHPYTKALLATAPIPDPKARRERIVLQGDIPSPLNPPSGCVFRTRCPQRDRRLRRDRAAARRGRRPARSPASATPSSTARQRLPPPEPGRQSALPTGPGRTSS